MGSSRGRFQRVRENAVFWSARMPALKVAYEDGAGKVALVGCNWGGDKVVFAVCQVDELPPSGAYTTVPFVLLWLCLAATAHAYFLPP